VGREGERRREGGREGGGEGDGVYVKRMDDALIIQ
jgi:hypothetical protein